jgi:hypothetical protein
VEDLSGNECFSDSQETYYSLSAKELVCNYGFRGFAREQSNRTSGILPRLGAEQMQFGPAQRLGNQLRSPCPSRFACESQNRRVVEHNAAEMDRLSATAFVSIGAVVDFAFGLVKWHSIVAGIIGIVCGLPLTGLLYLSFGARKGDDKSST